MGNFVIFNITKKELKNEIKLRNKKQRTRSIKRIS